MPMSLEKIVVYFSHPTVPPIVGQPSYKMISELKLKLNTDVASIYSHRGDGRLGLLYLTLKPEVYNTQSATQFGASSQPRSEPHHTG